MMKLDSGDSLVLGDPLTGDAGALGCELTIFSLMLWLGSPILASVAPEGDLACLIQMAIRMVA